MTSRMRSVCRRAVPVRAGGSRLASARALAACGLAILLQIGLPAPAAAQWGKLEKLSGPGPFYGWAFEFRVACFGDPPAAVALIAAARTLTDTARGSESTSPQWKDAFEGWKRVGAAWAVVLDEPYNPPSEPTPQGGGVDYRTLAQAAEEQAIRLGLRAQVPLMATSSAGVAWSFCRPDRERRFGVDLGWNHWEAGGQPAYASNEDILLDTFMASFSWRLLSGTKWDFLEASAGAGVFGFTSAGFPTERGLVIQPLRLTLRAPSSWSIKKPSDWRRWAAIPVYGRGFTLFPSGFDSTDFAGIDDTATAIPTELITTQYVFFNLQPLTRLLVK
jgi:hypothetical protein